MRKFFLPVLLLCAVYSLIAQADIRADISDPNAGVLDLSGTDVTAIRLFSSARSREYNLQDLSDEVALEPGSYRINRVEVGRYNSGFLHDAIEIEAGQTVKLPYGKPFEQGMHLQRSAGMLRLSHTLEGVGGIQFSNYINPPGFAIYQGDELIHSGKFAYG